ncbi:HPr family phosphocarrier protein [Bacillus mojavensis]|uniref:HPr family phosphocarrier protein n=1 Tax=Bacillus mojavensis TaxID=72360 RepID=UPI002DBC0CBC|nr:HPr family phosphocarrier protein [Bacillus mojavensis]MEC1292543.1 HPr family phosphocarrier protein [Bacillus mojavensis]MEC1703270.1 HPr family phosphocarrier protein [Bacillus mojavensis]MEC5247964.1 HPr family phosphocarrier protein [Bacillus mojavensis]
MIEKQYTMIASTGFARAAALLLRAACQFRSSIHLEYQGQAVDLKNTPKSLIDVMSLGIKPNTHIRIRANGVDEKQALQVIEDYLQKNKFTKK